MLGEGADGHRDRVHFHWCGSTKDLMVPLNRGSVPSEIIKAFGLPKKGAL